MGDIISLGAWIKRRRKALDLTQYELAQRVGCSLGLIQKIETDARRPSREIAARLADQLELAVAERAPFIQVARAELGADRLAPPAQSVARGAFVPAQAIPSAATLTQDHITPPTNLPTPPTALIGRAHETAQICALLRTPEARLVTLTGPGGIGKTRLALQIAAQMLDDFPDGISFVDLAPIRDPVLVSSAIAQTLGIKETGTQPLVAQLKQFLSDKGMLLLLDNFEQVLDTAPLLAELLAAAPQLKLLVTSRERLHLRGEKEVAVPPLELPPPTDDRLADVVGGPWSVVADYAAVQLFIQRASDVRPNFQLTNANAAAVAAICVRLDGMPLAIELAAARVKLFAPAALLARLRSPLALLTGGARDLPARQQTIRHTIDWSYHLLTEAEQTLFRRLGVFVGGCTLDAAERVLRTAGRGLSDAMIDSVRSPQSAALDGLAALVDKSLLRQAETPDGDPRFVMLETIRQYALEQLEASGEAEQLRRQHAAYYQTLGENVWLTEDGPQEGGAWVRRLQPEYDNFRSALAWSQTVAGDSEAALQLSSALEGLWAIRGVRHEAIAAMEQALNHPLGVGRTAAHWIIRWDLARLLTSTGKYAAARMHAEEVVLLARELGDTNLYAAGLERLGSLAREQGDSATAWARLNESLALVRERDDPFEIAKTLNTLAEIAILDEDPDRAEALLNESLAIGSAFSFSPWTLTHLGHAAQLRANYERATQLHRESLNHFDDTHFGRLRAYHGLGETALAQGRLDEAARWLKQGLALSQTLGDQASSAWCLAGLGSAAALDEAPERAARLWGAAEQLRQSIGCRPPPAARATYERAIALSRAQLGEEAFAAAWATGRALTLEQAIAEAVDDAAEAHIA